MLSGRTIVSSLVAALFSGAVGFASASYLQSQASRERITELENQRVLAEEANVRLRTWEIYGDWTGSEMRDYTRTVRLMLDRHPDASLATIESAPDVTPEEARALEEVMSFWSRFEDFANAQALNMEVAQSLMGPDAEGWAPKFFTLLNGVDCANPQGSSGKLIYAAMGTRRLAPEFAAPEHTPACVLEAIEARTTPDASARNVARRPPPVRPPPPRRNAPP